jgi:hypothetical protein
MRNVLMILEGFLYGGTYPNQGEVRRWRDEDESDRIPIRKNKLVKVKDGRRILIRFLPYCNHLILIGNDNTKTRFEGLVLSERRITITYGDQIATYPAHSEG